MSRQLIEAIELPAPASRAVAVALPACNEAATIAACLTALDLAAAAAPVTLVVLVNNSRDATAAIARDFQPAAATVVVDDVVLAPADAHAGGARRAALDRAAALLPPGGVLMTTDADSVVDRGWIAANLAEIAAGADAVAGVVAFDDAARAALPPLPLRALEWRLASLHARLGCLLDPRAHDPWPNHIWAWGASLALTVEAYAAVGGLPAIPLAEDRALAEAIEHAGLRLRHSHRPVVYTSPRRDGRAAGGFADLIHSYATDAAAPCDAALEPTAALVQRLRWRARLRRDLGAGFASAWRRIEASAPQLARQRVVPATLAAEVALAERLVSALEADRADSPRSALAA